MHRKLRCSRGAPCSNCVSRGITCDLEAIIRPPPGNTTASESELLERIRKLEELVELQRSQHVGSIRAKSETSETRAPPEQAATSNVSAQIEHLDKDVAWLASIYNGEYASVYILPMSYFPHIPDNH